MSIKIIAIIVWGKNNANNSVIMAIIAIIYTKKNKWYNRNDISDIIAVMGKMQ